MICPITNLLVTQLPNDAAVDKIMFKERVQYQLDNLVHDLLGLIPVKNRESILTEKEILHDNHQMEGVTRPLIFKFADTSGQKKMSTAIIQRNVGCGAVGGLSSVHPGVAGGVLHAQCSA